MKACDYCGGPSVRFTPANRDGFDVGPEILLCHRCADVPMHVIWSVLAEPSSHPHAFKPVHPIIALSTGAIESLRPLQGRKLARA